MAYERVQKTFGQFSSKKKHTPIVPPLNEEPTQVSSQSSHRVNISALPSKEKRDAIKRKILSSFTETNEIQSETLESSSVVGKGIQAKLTIGAPGDKYEQEADKVADLVVNLLNAPVAQQKSQNLQREDMSTDDELMMKSDTRCIQREAIPEEEERLQRSPKIQLQAGVGGVAAPAELETSIQQARGGGQLLADNIRQPMEQAFGADFSQVKVHTDGQSDQLNQSIQARAFTTGQDVFFRQGEYNPESRGGQELLAHELTHVVQQSGGVVQRSAQTKRVNDKTTATTKVHNNNVMPGLVQRGQKSSTQRTVEEIEGKNWYRFMKLQTLNIHVNPINTHNQFGHDLIITIELRNTSNTTLRFKTPPPLVYHERIKKVTTDANNNRNKEKESVNQYEEKPDSHTFRSYKYITTNEEVAPGDTLRVEVLDPAQLTIRQNYAYRRVKFKIGLKGSLQRINRVQVLECDNNNIIRQELT
ncbi:MAG: DUF4157 domain-containing protein [Rhizonema sp. NSF051]|nr:DUF4157 domain-containing protein [Rhizonema sp. NSF051]